MSMLPYGNARTTSGKVSCQHGAGECKVNMVEACAIRRLRDPRAYMEFIFCVEKFARSESPDALIEKCAKDDASAKSISSCYGDGEGVEGAAAIAAIANETQSLGHRYTPWLVINGQHSTSGERNLKRAICDVYKGPHRPAACDAGDADHAVVKCSREEVPVVV